MNPDQTVDAVDNDVEDEVVTLPDVADPNKDDGSEYYDPNFELTPEESLAVLMSATPVRSKRKINVKPRKGMGAVTLTLRSLTDREFKDAREAAKVPAGNRQQRRSGEMEVDQARFFRMMMAMATLEPNLRDPQLLAAQGVRHVDALIEKMFLPGNVSLISDEIMELSGYSDDAIHVIENLDPNA